MHIINEIRKRNPKFVVAGVITAAMLLGTTAISTISTTESVFAYRNNQATSQVNDCVNGFRPEDVGCQNTGSQIQGDKNTVSISSQQTFPGADPCEGCFDSLTPGQRADFLQALAELTGGPTITIDQLCAAFAGDNPESQRFLLDVVVRLLLEEVEVDEDTVNQIEECIEDVFGIPTRD
jgi:hypothetical protein